MDFEPKKLALLRILEILKRYSDADHPMLQRDIAEKLSSEFGINVERKSIGRNLSLLKEAGYEIASDKRGSWLAERDFEDSELRLLIDGVLSSRYITAKHSKELIDKLVGQSSEHFKPNVKHVHSVNAWQKTENPAVFYNIEIIDEAIREGKCISFVFNKFGVDKKMHPSSRHTVTPIQFVLHNQRYYLMSYSEDWQNVAYYRLDHVTDIKKLDRPVTDIRSIPGFRSGIDYGVLATSPYLFTDAAEKIEFVADVDAIDRVIDWLGTDVALKDIGNGKVKVTCKASPMAMEYWAMQFLNHVEIISPASLRDKIKSNLQQAQQKYDKEPQ